ncbi:uncharacterized protein LOC135096695 isoform X3 [Scylla paramamosain]|uniref:uncharacterized protein LOC135096695 isoform X3 n=1 Tax=Scylla paramamosain TaxID=85552 RepID=UPI003083795C
MVGGGRSRTESTTSHEESLDEARSASSHHRSRGQELLARQGHHPSHGDPDYSYAHPVKKQCLPPPLHCPPLTATVLNMERAARPRTGDATHWSFLKWSATTLPSSKWEVDWRWSLCCTVTQTSCHLAVQAVPRSVSLSLLCTALGTVCDIRLEWSLWSS